MLRLLVEEYIHTRRPVPSSLLADRVGVSPATARYDLLDLEASGLITKPHASAGRVPTRLGYQHYALSLLPPTPLPQSTVERLHKVLERAGHTWPRLVVQMASSLSGYAALLRLTESRDPKVLQVHLSALDGRRVLAVAVLEGGRVQEGLVQLGFAPSEALLHQAEALLRGPFPLSQLGRIPAPSPQLDSLLAALRQAFTPTWTERYREGTGAMLSEPEAEDPAFVRCALSALEFPPEDPLTPPGGVNVRVGEIEGLALVQAGFAEGSLRGELTLVGPMRMRYKEALSVAYSLSQALSGKESHAS